MADTGVSSVRMSASPAGDGFFVRAPVVERPTGGGAVRGIGEKFSAGAATGTGAMSVPIATSPGRSGFGPQLALSYDSGAGNGPFGTVFNNKGLPVRQYEPFFSATPLYEPEREMTDSGVSPILCYDPLGRLVATTHPNHTFAKIVFEPWRQAAYDASDTVLLDPAADADVGDFFSRLPTADYLPTWYQARVSGGLGADEQMAAQKAARHADTPTVEIADSLGRTCATVEHNRFERAGATIDEFYPTRRVLDIENNPREVRDAIVQAGDTDGRIVETVDFDLLGARLRQASMEAGERWRLGDATGKAIRTWDSRGFLRRTTYDVLRRATGLYVTFGGVERLAERTVYGEGQGTAANHRTRVYQMFDAAGVLTNEAYDFKGNALRSRRDLLADYREPVDWQTDPLPDDGTFVLSTTYDALNRATTATTPDGSVQRAAYNEAGLLETLAVSLRGAAAATDFIDDLDYNARGQRTLVRYASGAQTVYEYDPQTFRLTRLTTTRPPGGNGLASQLFKTATVLQGLRFTYDPAGNITRVADNALPVVAYDGQLIQPICDYVYDASYRLIAASGREHIGQTAFALASVNGGARDYPFAGISANDLQALRNYSEQYEYDAVGNLLRLRHQVGPTSWVRRYDYDEASAIEPTKTGNRLSASSVDPTPQTFAYDAHGNTMRMPHLQSLSWDFKDQLASSARQVVNAGTPETTFYVYDAAGRRVRKVTDRANSARRTESIYFGNFEVYREFGSVGETVELERETLQVMDDEQRIALVETLTKHAGVAVAAPTPRPRSQLGNHVGSCCLELDPSAALISYEEYHPYGTSSLQAMSGAAEVSLKRYRYIGLERDEENGLAYHGARYYAPWLGRWTACDPKGIASSLMLYGYARANPVMLVDRDGRQEIPSLAAPDCAANSHHKGNPFGPGARRGEDPADALLRRWNSFRESATRAVIWATSLGGTPEEMEKNYQRGTGQEYRPVPDTVTKPIVDATPQVAGDLWLQWAGGLKSPTAPARGLPNFEPTTPKVEPRPTAPSAPKEPLPKTEPQAKPPSAEAPPAKASPEAPEGAPKAAEPPSPAYGPSAAGRGVWDLGNGVRGRAIEQALSNKLPGTKFYKNFPNFDRAVYSSAGPGSPVLEVSQLKSLDFTLKGYSTRGGSIYRQLMNDAGELGGVGESLWEHGGYSVEIGAQTKRGARRRHSAGADDGRAGGRVQRGNHGCRLDRRRDQAAPDQMTGRGRPT
jgi:RHS repeat-associated protein